MVRLGVWQVPQDHMPVLLASATVLFYCLWCGGLLWLLLLCRALLFLCPIILLALFTPYLVMLPSPIVGHLVSLSPLTLRFITFFF